MKQAIMMPVYNRPDYLNQSLTAIKNNINADYDKYALVDAPKLPEHQENINKCIDILKNHDFNIIRREKNSHLNNNIWGQYELFIERSYDRIIVIEDDHVIKKGFFEWFDWCYANGYENATGWSDDFTCNDPTVMSYKNIFVNCTWTTTRNWWMKYFYPWACMVKTHGFMTTHNTFAITHPLGKKSVYYREKCTNAPYNFPYCWDWFLIQLYEIHGCRQAMPGVTRAINIGLYGAHVQGKHIMTDLRNITSDDFNIQYDFRRNKCMDGQSTYSTWIR